MGSICNKGPKLTTFANKKPFSVIKENKDEINKQKAEQALFETKIRIAKQREVAQKQIQQQITELIKKIPTVSISAEEKMQFMKALHAKISEYQQKERNNNKYQ